MKLLLFLIAITTSSLSYGFDCSEKNLNGLLSSGYPLEYELYKIEAGLKYANWIEKVEKEGLTLENKKIGNEFAREVVKAINKIDVAFQNKPIKHCTNELSDYIRNSKSEFMKFHAKYTLNKSSSNG